MSVNISGKICRPISLLLLFPVLLSGETHEDAVRLYQHGQYEQAAALFSQIADGSPQDADPRCWLGKAYLKTQKWDPAVREFEKTVQLEPSNAMYRIWLGRACGARASHSIFFKAFGWARRVIKEFEIARNISPANLDVRWDLLAYYLDAPGIVGGGKNKAEAEAQAISKLNARHGFSARALLFEKDKKWDLARKELVQATVEFPNDADAYKDLAEFLLKRQDFAGALDNAQKALAINGKSTQSKLIMFAAKVRLLQDLENAEQSLREMTAGPLTDDDPGFEEAFYWLGECYRAKGDKKRAQESYRSALSFNPDYNPAKGALSGLK